MFLKAYIAYPADKIGNDLPNGCYDVRKYLFVFIITLFKQQGRYRVFFVLVGVRLFKKAAGSERSRGEQFVTFLMQ